jgi:hypothetical protein
LASFTTIRQGQSLGVFPLEHVARFTDAFVELFPQHAVTIVSDGQQDAEVFVYPRLDRAEREAWDACLERLSLSLDC